MWYFIGVLGALLAGFLWRRYTSVQRGEDARDARILRDLQRIADKLRAGCTVDPTEVAALAAVPQNRPLLHALLKHYEQLALFPAEYLSVEAQALANLSYWMMHPNELQDPPAAIEIVETVARSLDGVNADFVVLRYRMPDRHWAAGNGWMLGLSGPFLTSEPPYSGVASAFSHCSDKYGSTMPGELVDWFIRLVRGKSA